MVSPVAYSDLYRQVLRKLQQDNDKLASLRELWNLFTYKPAMETTDTVRNVGISKILQCLNVADKKHVDLTCEVIKACFDKFQPGDFIKNYTSNIMYLLRHEKSCVRKLAVDEVYKAVALDVTTLPFPQYIDVFVVVAQLVCDNDISISNKAILIISNLSFDAYPKVLDEMKIALEYDARTKCNAYEVVINISTKSFELFELCVEHGYIISMVSELQSEDILYILNIVELLSRLAIKPHGINYLIQEGALDKLSEFIVNLDNSNLLLPGLMTFFGCIAHYYPREIFNKYPVLINLVFDALDQGDQSLLPVTLDTLGYIGITVEGKLCLAALGGKYTQGVEKVGTYIRNNTSEIKVRGLNCFASLIRIDKELDTSENKPVDQRVTLMTREWFRSLSSQPTAIATLFEICKNPFTDLRLAGFLLLDAVCQHHWGQELVATTAGFIEYLLDRTVEYTKECKETKFGIIKRLSNSPAFDAPIISRMQTYVEQGPFYSELEFEVTMEEQE